MMKDFSECKSYAALASMIKRKARTFNQNFRTLAVIAPTYQHYPNNAYLSSTKVGASTSTFFTLQDFHLRTSGQLRELPCQSDCVQFSISFSWDRNEAEKLGYVEVGGANHRCNQNVKRQLMPNLGFLKLYRQDCLVGTDLPPELANEMFDPLLCKRHHLTCLN